MRKLSYNGYVTEDGDVKIYNPSLMKLEVGKLFIGRKITYTVTDLKNPMSNLQMRYYRGCMLPMIQEGMIDAGWRVSLEEVHDLVGRKFFMKEVVNEDTGEIISFVESTTEMSTIEFMNRKEAIQQWAAEYLNIVIPDPEKQIKAKL